MYPMKGMKLWHCTDQLFNRSPQSSVVGRRCAPGRHGTLAFKSHRHDRVHTLGDQRTPGGLVAQLGSIGYPRAMAGNASRFVQLLSGGMPRCLACACNSHRFCCGGSSSLFRSEEHTSELQSIMRISYAVFCLKKTQSNT